MHKINQQWSWVLSLAFPFHITKKATFHQKQGMVTWSHQKTSYTHDNQPYNFIILLTKRSSHKRFGQLKFYPKALKRKNIERVRKVLHDMTQSIDVCLAFCFVNFQHEWCFWSLKMMAKVKPDDTESQKKGDGLILLPITVLCPCCINCPSPPPLHSKFLSQLHSVYFDFLMAFLHGLKMYICPNFF